MKMNNIKIPDASGILGWSHYCELIAIKDENKRNFYEKETVNSKWSVRELQRQIETSLFERLLLSDGKANKEKVLQLQIDDQIVRQVGTQLEDGNSLGRRDEARRGRRLPHVHCLVQGLHVQ